MPIIEEQIDNVPVEKNTRSLFQWFSPLNWLAGLIAFAVSFATYVYTLQPTVGLEDSGELITAAYKLGVPHPPGYPMWTLLSKLFTFIPIGDIAWRVNLLSAMGGALAAAMITLVLAKMGDLLFNKNDSELAGNEIIPGVTTHGLVVSICAIAAGILFAYTPGAWSQSTIAEVYAMNAFYMALIVLLSFVFLFNPSHRKLFCVISFVFALAITNHMTICMMMGSLIWLAWSTRKSDDSFIQIAVNAAILLAFTLFMFHWASWNGRPVHMSPFHFNEFGEKGNFFILFCFPFIVYLVAAYFVNSRLFNDLEWPNLAASFLGGLCIYFYLPLSSITNPQLNWARPSTVEGFWHSVLRKQYEKIAFKRDPKYFLDQCGLYLKDTWDQYPLVLIFAFLSIVTLIVVWKKVKQRDWIIYCMITFLACGIGMVFLMNPKLDVTSQYINRVFFIMSNGGLALLVGIGMITLATMLLPLAHKHKATWRQPVMLIGLFFVLFGAYFATISIVTSTQYPNTPFASSQSKAVVHSEKLLDLAETSFSRATILEAISYNIKSQPAVDYIIAEIPAEEKNQFFEGVYLPGFGDALAADIIAKKPATDILSKMNKVLSDSTSTKLITAKISTDVMLRGILFSSIFILIGIVLLAGVITPQAGAVCSVFIALLLLATPFIPACKHWAEMNLRKKYFGYIYGIEMLKSCDQGAVFYGGTDPGRFVPLYMINCDKFRSDVWLITQNGLADGTYMNVLRDRFCRPKKVNGAVRAVLKALDAEREDHKGEDTIYIPSEADFQGAFEEYMVDVKARNARGEDVSSEVNLQGGKISVSGVAGVMRINGILTRMIWEKNVEKHSFYVEESYVIPWMYPYLEPAGMIMKLCAERTKITAAKVAADFAYWNNLTNIFDNGGYIDFEDINDGRKGRIILDAKEFKDDITAQKSFSKCRSALAGLYENRGMWKEAEAAYKQAIWLYPASAEAFMRLAQLYTKMNKYDAALELAEEYKRMDPLNFRVDGMIDIIRQQRDANALISELQAKVFSDQATWEEYLQLASYYEQRGQGALAANVYKKILDPKSNVTNEMALTYLAQKFSENKDVANLKKTIKRIVDVNPTNWKAYVDLAALQLQYNEVNDAIATLKKAKVIEPELVVARLWQDTRFKTLQVLHKEKFDELTKADE